MCRISFNKHKKSAGLKVCIITQWYSVASEVHQKVAAIFGDSNDHLSNSKSLNHIKSKKIRQYSIS